MAVLTADLSRLPKDVRERLKRTLSDRFAAKLAIAKVNQAKLSKIYNEGAVPGSAHKDFGPCFMVMDPFLEWYFSRVCQDREMVWSDPEFLKWLQKQEGGFRVKHAPTKIQVGHR